MRVGQHSTVQAPESMVNMSRLVKASLPFMQIMNILGCTSLLVLLSSIDIFGQEISEGIYPY